MKIFFPFLFYIVSSVGQPVSSAKKLFGETDKPGNKIMVALRMNPAALKDSGKVTCRPAEYILAPTTHSAFRSPQNGSLQIEMVAEEPVYLGFTDLLRVKKCGYYLAEPGDEVVITSNGGGFAFSGKGAEKYRLQYQLDSLAGSIPKASHKTGTATFYLDSLEEYFAWTHYCRQKITLAVPLLNSYKGKISDEAFGIITDAYIKDVLQKLRDQFYSLMENGLSRKKIFRESLIRIYDTSYSKAMQECIDHAINKPLMSLEFKAHQIQRRFSFDSLQVPAAHDITLYLLEDIMRVHKGQELERLMVNRLPKAMLKIGFTPAMEKLLTAYYAKPGYPEWKKWMKERELETRIKLLGYKAPDLTLTDVEGKRVTNKDLKGKIAILYFRGPVNSKHRTADAMVRKAVEKYKDHPDIVLVDIPAERSDDLVKAYAVTSFPWIWVMDTAGKVINADPRLDLTQGNGEALVTFIQKKIDYDKALHQKMIAYKKDGPYIFHEGEVAVAYSIDDTSVVHTVVDKSDWRQLSVQTDLEKMFHVRLHSSIAIQPAVYKAADKLLVFSDIEGNFDAFRKLLQANKIIDENFNWIFGKGHLVFAGDMFDRGMQVTECLWLMYALEEKARVSGGYVHFVLGNHEIMNMQGNHYYAKSKYKKNAALMGRSLTDLYNEHSELGKWLRTKNIIEKIGDLLFVHGGISPEVNRLPLGIEEINTLARPYYGRKVDSANAALLTVYDSRYGEKYRISPFWSRGYYKGSITKRIDKVSSEQLDTTLRKFDVRRIVTGHTIVADTISVHYGRRVINTDTKHAKGKSEALLIEGDRYYRVNDRGDKILLFIDEKLKIKTR